uniref:Uncharacterized protein LOC104241422 n=1 Tax=Nicotiana sylvestris TaxID=4096 RepID=A0A1U7XYF6_NICSY|nr:PREDICTED: uncharacterized protein LOC104241422 [Nicotiana sylvestris]
MEVVTALRDFHRSECTNWQKWVSERKWRLASHFVGGISLDKNSDWLREYFKVFAGVFEVVIGPLAMLLVLDLLSLQRLLLLKKAKEKHMTDGKTSSKAVISERHLMKSSFAIFIEILCQFFNRIHVLSMKHIEYRISNYIQISSSFLC